MKKINIIVTFFIASLMVLSCSTDFNNVNSDHTDVIGFSSPDKRIPVSENSPEITVSINFFVSNMSSSERTFNLTVVEEETELLEATYSFDAFVVVPANERSGSLMFTALNDSSLTNDFQPMVIAFEGTSEISSGNSITVEIKTND